MEVELYPITILKGLQPLKVDILDCDKKSIVYSVAGTPICQYDQHSRARVGVKFENYKVNENPIYIFYSNVFDQMCDDFEYMQEIHETFEELEGLRGASTFPTTYNLMTRECSYTVVQEFSSLKGQMARRLKFCEEEFIVGLHWVLRDKMIKYSPETENIAKSFLPGCDALGICDYASADYLSNMFGCLFAGCGRWPDNAKYASFNQSCTTPELVEEQTGIVIPRSKYELSLKK